MLTTYSNRLPPDRRTHGKSFARAAGSFVPKLTAKVFERYGFHSAEIMTSWERVAGADIARFCAPERIKWPRPAPDGETDAAGAGATLVLRVEPARALDIEYRTREIADRINRYFGYRAVSQIKIVQAPLLTNTTPEPAARAPAAAPDTLGEVSDGALRSALTELWSAIALERARR